MYRKAMEKLREWKKSTHRKPLLIRGARQTGKTWLINIPLYAINSIDQIAENL